MKKLLIIGLLITSITSYTQKKEVNIQIQPLTKNIHMLIGQGGNIGVFKNENIKVYHVHNAHTDGDVLIYFANGNVLHMGDTFFNGRYPYIDLKSGGSIKGYIKASEKALLLANDDTKIIPGHGKLASKKDLETFLTMLKEITAIIQKEIDTGKSENDIINNALLTANYDEKGYGNGYINPKQMRKTIYQSLIRSK